MEKSKCRSAAQTYGPDEDPFFPSNNDTLYVIAVTQYCAFCTVKDECGAFGTKYNLEGVWGGIKRVRSKR